MNWTTFGTGKGFFADYIVAGTMLADRIYGGTLTLGGYNNQNGKMVIQDASGNELGEWDNNGIRSTGHYVSYDPKSKKQVDVYRGRMVFSNTYGHYASIEEGGDAQIPAVRLSATKDGVTDQFMEVSGMEIRGQHQDITFMAKNRTTILAKEMRVGSPERSYLTKNGKAEFSDGSYLEFKNGMLIGGGTASGSTF